MRKLLTAVAVLATLGASLVEPHAQSEINWRFVEETDPISDKKQQFLYGRPAQGGDGGGNQYIRIGCYADRMGVTLAWGTMLTPMQRDGNVPMAVVTARFDERAPFQLGWAASESFEFTYAPNALAGAMAQLGNSLLRSFLPGIEGVNSTWNARELHFAMLSSDRAVFRADSRRGPTVTLVFDTRSYRREALKFNRNCNPSELYEAAQKSGVATGQASQRPSPPQSSIDLMGANWTDVGFIRPLFQRRSPELGKYLIGDDSKIEAIKLPWSPGTALVRIKDKSWNNPALYMYYLYKADQVVHLNGTAPPIHQFNAKNPIVLSDETAPHYLWFFTFFVRGADGPFLVVESDTDSLFPNFPADQKSQSLRRDTAKRLKNVNCLRDSTDYKCKATIYYSNAIFEASFTLKQTGMVEMGSDTPVAAELPARINAPIN